MIWGQGAPAPLYRRKRSRRQNVLPLFIVSAPPEHDSTYIWTADTVIMSGRVRDHHETFRACRNLVDARQNVRPMRFRWDLRGVFGPPGLTRDREWTANAEYRTYGGPGHENCSSPPPRRPTTATTVLPRLLPRR